MYKARVGQSNFEEEGMRIRVPSRLKELGFGGERARLGGEIAWQFTYLQGKFDQISF